MAGDGASPMEGDAHLSPVTPLDPPAAYPAGLNREEILPDGTPIRVRPIVPADIERVRHAFAVGDVETIRGRFFTGAPPSGEDHLHYLVEIDYVMRLALVAIDMDGNSIGIARYEGVEGLGSAEIAIVVDPEWRSRSVGRTLVTALEAPARDAGITEFEALFLPGNRVIAALLESLGYGDRRLEDGLVRVTKPIS